jgi:hypothetical protein
MLESVTGMHRITSRDWGRYPILRPRTPTSVEVDVIDRPGAPSSAHWRSIAGPPPRRWQMRWLMRQALSPRDSFDPPRSRGAGNPMKYLYCLLSFASPPPLSLNPSSTSNLPTPSAQSSTRSRCRFA